MTVQILDLGTLPVATGPDFSWPPIDITPYDRFQFQIDCTFQNTADTTLYAYIEVSVDGLVWNEVAGTRVHLIGDISDPTNDVTTHSWGDSAPAYVLARVTLSKISAAADSYGSVKFAGITLNR